VSGDLNAIAIMTQLIIYDFPQYSPTTTAIQNPSITLTQMSKTEKSHFKFSYYIAHMQFSIQRNTRTQSPWIHDRSTFWTQQRPISFQNSQRESC